MSDYRLLQPHKINNAMQPVGYVIEDAPNQIGKWWVEQGIAERIDVVPAPRAVVKAITAPIPAPVVAAPARRFGCCGWSR